VVINGALLGYGPPKPSRNFGGPRYFALLVSFLLIYLNRQLTETSPLASIVGSDGGGRTPSPEGSLTTTQHLTQSENDSRPNDEQESQLIGHSSDLNDASKEDVYGDDTCIPFPLLPPAPSERFPREELVNEILDLTDQVASVAIFGSNGVGKSFVAGTVLDHSRTKAIFGENRYLVHCDLDLAHSFEGYIGRLSDAIGVGHPANEAQLRSHLETSPPLILLLDCVDFILDPRTPESDISATIEEFGYYENICLVTTSRMDPNIHGFHRVEIPTSASEDDTRHIFYSLCSLDRSSAVYSLIVGLDCHPPSIDVRENNWDDDQANALRTSYYQTLKETVEPMLHSQTIERLGAIARDVLGAIGAFPSGIKEYKLESIFPRVGGIGEVVETLCKFSLIYRQGGVVKMASPTQSFLESTVVPAQTEETIHVSWGPNCMPAQACKSFSVHLFYGYG
jgi:hypothetical protein